MLLVTSFPALTFSSGDVSNDVDVDNGAKLEEDRRLDSYAELMTIASEQIMENGSIITNCHGECWELETKYVPLNMDGQGRTELGSPLECQARCQAVAGCAHFSFWVNGGCHIQDATSVPQPPTEVDGGYTELSGPRECPPMNAEQKAIEGSGKCTTTTTTKFVATIEEEDDNTGLIVGIIIACIVLLLCCLLVALLLYRRRKPKEEPAPPPMLASPEPEPVKEEPVIVEPPAREESESTVI